MKKLILLLLITTISSCASKVTEGKYCNSFNGGYSSQCIDFNNRHTFNWQTSTDFGPPTIGQGKYEVKNNKLYLIFKKDSLNYESKGEVLNTEVPGKDEVSLVIKVVDEQNMPSPNARITINGNKGERYFSDIEGLIKIQHIPKNEDPIEILVEPLDFLESYNFNYTPNKNANLLVTLYKAKPKLITDKTFVYEIIDKSLQKLTLKNSVGQTLEFKRIKE